MRTDLLKRLEGVSRQVGGADQVIVVKTYLDETKEACEDKLARWRAGEDAAAIESMPSAGGELVVFTRSFLQWSDGTAVTQGEYAKWCETGWRKAD